MGMEVLPGIAVILDTTSRRKACLPVLELEHGRVEFIPVNRYFCFLFFVTKKTTQAWYFLVFFNDLFFISAINCYIFLQIACGSPFLPANSKAEISLKDGVFTSKLICKPGYKLQGQQYSSCLSNRAWENNM